MKLVSLTKQGDVHVGDSLIAISGVFKGQMIRVQEICPPDIQFGDGRIKYNMSEAGGYQHLLPRVVNCVFVPDDSLLATITYDNEKTVGAYLGEIIKKLEADNRECRRFILGDKELTRVEHMLKLGLPDQMGFSYRYFADVRVSEFRHYESLLVVEHAPKVLVQDDEVAETEESKVVPSER